LDARDRHERDRECKIPRARSPFSVYWRGRLGCDTIVSGSAPARLGSAARNVQRFHFPAFAGGMRFDDAGGRIADRIMANDAGPRLSLVGVRQYSAHSIGPRTGSL